MPSPLSILLIALFIGIAATGFWMRDKTIRAEQMTAQYNLGYRTAENDLMKAATDAGQRATSKFEAVEREARALSDDALDRRADALGIMCVGKEC